MDNKDFDKIFSDRLQEEQHFDFQESDWDEVVSSIQKKPRRKFLWWMWLIPFLFAGFAIVIYSLKSDLNEANKEVLNLNQKIKKLEILKSDTQYQTVTITKYDTIQKIIFEEKNFQIKGNRTQEISPKLISTIKETSPKEVIKSLADSVFMDSKIDSDDKTLNEAITLLELIDLREEGELDLPEEKEKRFYLKEISRNKEQSLFTDRLKIGLTNAWGVNEKYENGFYNSDTISSLKGFMFDFGIRSEWAFNKRWRAMATIGFERITLKGAHLSDFYRGLLVPSYSSNFIEAMTVQTNVNYQLGIKYFLLKNKMWIPYIGTSLNAQSNLGQKITASYLVNNDYSESNSLTIRRPDFRLNSVSQLFGFEYRISNRLSWQIEQWYRFNVWKSEGQNYARFGIRNTVLFHF